MSDSAGERTTANKWKVNLRLVPVKAHFFFFMAAMGPILPFLNVFGKQLGVSEVVMGTITAVLPILFLLAKPLFGFFIDYFQQHRKLVFTCLVATTSTFYVLLGFVPQPQGLTLAASCHELLPCSPSVEGMRFHCIVGSVPIPYGGLIASIASDIGPQDNVVIHLEKLEAMRCDRSEIHPVFCDWKCADNSSGSELLALAVRNDTSNGGWRVCLETNSSSLVCHSKEETCDLMCQPGNMSAGKECLYGTPAFWGFLLLMALGTIGFNVANSVSDAICFDVLGSGAEMKYGQQRVFGTVGFGVTAFLAGLAIDWWSAGNAVKDYTPAFFLVFVFTVVDIYCCTKLKLPRMPRSQSILKDVGKLLKHKQIIIFIIFATLAGINDSFIIYYLFWYLEDLALATNSMATIKLLEGLVIAAETLVGEVIFFTLSGKILKKIGFGYSLTMCFFFYSVRLALVATIPSPWWLLPVELFLQGPTYAMCYTTIVAYASAVAPPGASATMQGLVAGMDDGFGYAVGSLMGGVLYRWLGGRAAFTIAAALSLLCSLVHGVLYECMLKHTMVQAGHAGEHRYKAPEVAAAITDVALSESPEKNES